MRCQAPASRQRYPRPPCAEVSAICTDRLHRVMFGFVDLANRVSVPGVQRRVPIASGDEPRGDAERTHVQSKPGWEPQYGYSVKHGAWDLYPQRHVYPWWAAE